MFSWLRYNKKALTLVEAVCSVFILAIFIGMFLSAFTVAKLATLNAKHRTKAMNLLTAKMEWVKSQNYVTIEGWIGNDIVENNVDNTVGQDELINDTRTTSVSKDANGNLIVTITLNWEKRGITGTLAKGTALNPDEKLVTLISS